MSGKRLYVTSVCVPPLQLFCELQTALQLRTAGLRNRNMEFWKENSLERKMGLRNSLRKEEETFRNQKGKDERMGTSSGSSIPLIGAPGTRQQRESRGGNAPKTDTSLYIPRTARRGFLDRDVSVRELHCGWEQSLINKDDVWSIRSPGRKTRFLMIPETQLGDEQKTHPEHGTAHRSCKEIQGCLQSVQGNYFQTGILHPAKPSLEPKGRIKTLLHICLSCFLF